MRKIKIIILCGLIAAGLLAVTNFVLANDLEWTTISGTSNIYNTNLGRVGIGTTSPHAALHVDTSTLPIKYRRAGGGGSGSLNIDNVMSGSGGDMMYKPIPDSGNGAGHAFYVNNGSADLFALGITRYGNIGIGTTSPGSMLTVNKNAVTLPTPLSGTVVQIGQADATGNLLLLDSFGAASVFAGRRANGTNASPSRLLNGQGYFHMLGYGYGSTGYSSGPRAAISFFTAQDWTDTAQGTLISFKVTPNNSTTLTEAMLIDNIGNIGIGTSSPQAKLAVNGTITTKKIKVTETGWSDFVFDNGYKLPTLAAVESHIKQYKHLPGIPSAQEIKQKGLDVSDVLAKQMQKIEELTLYLIEIQKENQDLKKRINALEKQVTQN